MAAGLGSRYGSAKQIAAVGPSGETLLEYAIYDARLAGFRRVVFIIRAALAPMFVELSERLPSDLDVTSVVQDIDDLPPGFVRPPSRTRPWGTVHAVLATRSVVTTPFVALNADDFYGRDAYAMAMAACREAEADGSGTIIGFPLEATLSPNGSVVRGICETDGDELTSLREVYGVERTEQGIRGHTRDGAAVLLTGQEIASMNMWALPREIFDSLSERLGDFLRAHGQEDDSELPLPDAIGALVAAGGCRVRVRRAPGPWMGLTHAQDRDALVTTLRGFVEEGRYPSPLWGDR
jgi:hypothetical protein